MQERALSVRAWETRSEERVSPCLFCVGRRAGGRGAQSRRGGGEQAGAVRDRVGLSAEVLEDVRRQRHSETLRDKAITHQGHGAHSYHIPFQGGPALLCKAFLLLRVCPGLSGERNPSGQQ